MKRLLSLATLYPNAARPRFGTFVASSMQALAARPDWEVTVINPIGLPPVRMGEYRALEEAAVDGRSNGLSVYRPSFTLLPKVGGRLNPAMIARAVLPLARELHARQPFDLIDAQFFYPDGPAAATIARALDLPLAIKARGADIHYWGSRGFGRAKMLDAARQADRVLAVSEALAQDMAALGMDRGRIAIHYTGLDRDRFRPLQNAGLRRMLGERLGVALPEKGPLIATVGALIERKGQKMVVRALAQLPDAQLLLVGKGPDEPQARAGRRAGRGRAGPLFGPAGPRSAAAGALSRRCDGAALGQRGARQCVGRSACLRHSAGDLRCRRRARAGARSCRRGAGGTKQRCGG